MTFNHDIKKGITLKALLTIMLFSTLWMQVAAAPLNYEPVKLKLPNGHTLDLFVSGDEFFNYLHDKDGYPVAIGDDGYYYYQVQNGDIFLNSGIRAGARDPRFIPGVKQVTIPSYVASKRNRFFTEMEAYRAKTALKSGTKSTGEFNNLVIYIRFADETNFVVPRSDYDSKFNATTGASVRTYFDEVSFGKLDLISYHLPGGSTQNISYQDENPRKYFQPYNVTTNPTGYQSESERATREHLMLKRACLWVEANYSLPAGVDFDSDNDGYFDNVSFIVRGSSDGWSDLLWPHRWVLYSTSAKIFGLTVYDYTFQLENTSSKTLSHELFHSLGAPDLYRYVSSGTPVGKWDIMANGTGHPLAWMKSKYGGWITNIPIITRSGYYTLYPATSEEKNSYRIKSPYSPTEMFGLEFRKKTGLYEDNIPESGLIVYRIDNRYRGNSNGPPDELYVFRTGGTPTLDGSPTKAAFSDLMGKPSFDETTLPYPFLQNGSKAGIYISEITDHGDSLTFYLDTDKIVDLEAEAYGDSEIRLSWECASNNRYLVIASSTQETIIPQNGIDYQAGDPIGTNGVVVQNGLLKTATHSNLDSDTYYYYQIWSAYPETPSEYFNPVGVAGLTGIYTVTQLPHTESFDQLSGERLPRGWKGTGSPSATSIYANEAYSLPNAILMRSQDPFAESWFYTPGLLMNATKKHLITFRYKALSPDEPASFTLYGGVGRYGSDLSVVFMDVNEIRYSDFVLARFVHRTSTNAPYYFGFKLPYGKGGVIIDEFKVELVPKETENINNPASFFPNPTSGMITVPATRETVVSVFRTNGHLVFSRTIEATTEVDLSALPKGIYIIKFKDNRSESSHRIVIM